MNATHPTPSSHPRDMVTHLQALARARPADTALVAVSAEGDVPFDYATLDARVKALAGELQARFAPGDRALLLDDDAHFVIAFFACLYAGLVAVPVSPPESLRPHHLARLAAISSDCRPRCVLARSQTLAQLGAHEAVFAGAIPLAVDGTHGAAWRPHAPADGDIAFLQYTSGSTATPKGVMVSHGNLMANERAIEERLGVRTDDVFVTWLPLYHDMGLIGGLLQPFHRGIPVVLMSPAHFLERPVRWLEAISRHRGTISGGPDFAYRLCLERIKDGRLAALDLSSWRVAFSGAEPVRHDTLDAFVRHFGVAGLSADAVYPCYGLAEATLLVTGGQRGEGLVARAFSAESLAAGRPRPGEGGAMLVGCGFAPAGHRVEIVEPESMAVVTDGRVGEVWASGPSIARGYWQRPVESGETFVERGGHRWLRTGDLGFQHDGQLFITGRIKDLIVLRGRNVYPQDLEQAIEAEVDAVRKGRVAAFAVSLPDGGEGVGVAAEVSRGLQKLVPVERLVEALSLAVSEVCREPVSVALLLNPGGLPKTSSGKLQRAACRSGWQQQSLDTYAVFAHGRFLQGDVAAPQDTAPLDASATDLAALWGEALPPQAPAARPGSHFFAHGGNSLAAVRLAARIGDRWGIEFPVRTLFEHPRFEDLAREVRRLRDSGQGVSRTPIPALPATLRTGPLPLSHAQERQWFLWNFDPSGTAYHVAGAVRLTGDLDTHALRQAFSAVVARHEALRTVFRAGDDGVASQWIQPPAPFDVPLVDAPGEALAHEALQRLRSAPFDLRTGPLLRAALVRVAGDTHLLAVVAHHIVCDGASMQVLLGDLGEAFRALQAGRPPAWTPLAIQPADHGVWQRDWLAGGERQRQLTYWRGQLGDTHPVLALPTDRPRRAEARHTAARLVSTVPADTAAALRHVADRHGATVVMALMAGFQGLLYRCTGEPDIRLGVPVANRTRTETEGLVGFFVNTLVLRNCVHDRMSLGQVLDQARDAAIGAQAHQDLPFEQLVEALQVERSLSHSPLFQVAFNHLHEDLAALALPGVTATPHAVDDDAAPFELTLDLRERPDGAVDVAWRYARELFDAGTIARFARYFGILLQALATQPDTALGAVALMSDDETHALLKQGDTTADAPLAAGGLHHRVEACAARFPDDVAVVAGDVSLTYRELDTRANRLAHHLLRAGVQRDVRVGIAMERGVDVVVAQLAVLKAGGAYVPIDPASPAERLAWQVGDSGMRLLLLHAAQRDALAAAGASRVLAVDTLDLSGEPDDPPSVAVHADQLAYVIYTSGSTGRPKGAQLSHRNVLRLMASTAGRFHFDRHDVWTLFHSPAFDFSVWEIFGALCHGGRLVIVPQAVSRAPDAFLDLLRRERVTVLNQTPSAFRELMQVPALQPGGIDSLRFVIFGGEALEPRMLAPWIERFGDARPQLVNMYGITETTVHVTYRAITSADLASGSRSPIGGQIPDLALRVLDTRLAPVPVGVPGELHVAGAGLARGYLDRAGLTAERFIADPFDPAGGRLYRTGDLVRWREGGEIEYLGRIDHQVKVRGFRIELGEIESRLQAQAGVAQALVVPRDGAGGTVLHAYVARRADAEPPQTADLRDALRRVLPDYMVPASVTVLDAFPLNANGKIDRRALPAPDVTAGTAYTAPDDDMERCLAALWAELLEVPRVGRHDNFFEIGGHSLLLMKVHRRLETLLGATVSIVDLFRHPTVATLAAHLAQRPAEPVADEAPERARRQRNAFLPRRPTAERTPS